ncbi:hypothetical protein BXQ17_03645 [Polaribacter sp. BM10]|uniref:hypothetical protein n=1 Tax=Polaribacter sp. BM10 TaxID=1529069 RepID=UPI00098B94FB|nr:hypothetical protein [Polaribacter sp. BM10]AQS93225.1 hypothetical protein BXQ17_03645 [Polaribacter sp. BM10]
MPLEISKKDNKFYLKGKINSETVPYFISFFDKIRSKQIIININNIKEIDKLGLLTIYNFLDKSHINNMLFSIEGYGCKEIYDYFQEMKIA